MGLAFGFDMSRLIAWLAGFAYRHSLGMPYVYPDN